MKVSALRIIIIVRLKADTKLVKKMRQIEE